MLANDTFLRACRGERTAYAPAWYMRQAGRYQPEYMAVRKRHSLLEICEQPELCVQVTLLPVSQLGVDAAILFSDIMVPLAPMGVDFRLEKDMGPIVEQPLQSADDIGRLRTLDPQEHLPHVLESVRLLAAELTVPLIGFSGAPFTLASYLIEGGPSRDHLRTKTFMLREPAVWAQLMDKLADMAVVYLRAQVAAGASAVQLFDSWVGSLAREDFDRFVLPAVQKVFRELSALGVPMIYFGVGASHLFSSIGSTGATVVGVDWRMGLSDARRSLGGGVAAVQGNLEPAALLGPWDELRRRASAVIADGRQEAGFVFNLGHGVPRYADVDTLRRLTDFVHESSAAAAGDARGEGPAMATGSAAARRPAPGRPSAGETGA